MNNKEIETFVSKILRQKIETLIAESVAGVNAQGHALEIVDDGISEWVSPLQTDAWRSTE